MSSFAALRTTTRAELWFDGNKMTQASLCSTIPIRAKSSGTRRAAASDQRDRIGQARRNRRQRPAPCQVFRHVRWLFHRPAGRFRASGAPPENRPGTEGDPAARRLAPSDVVVIPVELEAVALVLDVGRVRRREMRRHQERALLDAIGQQGMATFAREIEVLAEAAV